jgi:hypothetical protein
VLIGMVWRTIGTHAITIVTGGEPNTWMVGTGGSSSLVHIK